MGILVFILCYNLYMSSRLRGQKDSPPPPHFLFVSLSKEEKKKTVDGGIDFIENGHTDASFFFVFLKIIS